MSIEYCEKCHKHIDLDYNSEHFIVLVSGESVCGRFAIVHDDGVVTDEDGFVLGELDY